MGSYRLGPVPPATRPHLRTRIAILPRLCDVPSYPECRVARQTRRAKILHEAMVHFGGCPSVYMSNLWRFTRLTFCSRSFIGTSTCSEHQLWYLFHEFGASTRELAAYGLDPESYEAVLKQKIHEITTDNLPHIFQNPSSSQTSHYIITIYPEEGNRYTFEKKWSSRRVFDMVWERHLSNRVDLMEEFYNLFLATPITATPAGWVFEDRMHQVLRTERTLQLFPIPPRHGKTNVTFDNYAASKTKNNPTEFQLTHSKEHRLVERATLRMNHYYRPQSSNFAAVGSVLLIHPPNEPPILLMFQMTRNKTKHDTKPSGLQKIDGLIVPQGTRKYLVIVTPENIHPGITVPLEYFGGKVEIESDATGGVEGEEDQDEEDQDEEMDVVQYEETGESQDEETDDGQNNTTGGGQWALFQVFHCPIDIGRLFNP